MRNHFLPAVALALSLMLAPTPALAHAKLVGSTPAANAAVSKVTSITLRFNEKLAAATVKTDLLMTSMPGMADHPPMKIAATPTMGKDGKSMTLLAKRALVPGTYNVKWSAAGADAHPMKGEFGFTVK